MEVTHSMQRGILWAMSLVLKSCLSTPFTQSRTCEPMRVGDLIGSHEVGPDGREGIA